ncbi:MAG: LysR family transcriptional regulator [Zoogloeaceae bacterium]|nr:LysR family transcriptional regulator [Zoogloeaceae bacterium]
MAETGSLGRAAARLSRSESAISLQMSRLEDVAGTALFDRDGRTLKLNQAGVTLLGHARAILARVDAARADLKLAREGGAVRMGLVQDFSGDLLVEALRRFRVDSPRSQVQIMIAGTSDLLVALSEERLDFALCARTPLVGKPLITLPMGWFGDPALLGEEVLPLATIAPPCPFLSAATAALDAVGRPYRLAIVTPSLDGVRAAARAGLGIACRTVLAMGELPLTDARFPQLPEVAYDLATLKQRGTASRELEQALREEISRHASAHAQAAKAPG